MAQFLMDPAGKETAKSGQLGLMGQSTGQRKRQKREQTSKDGFEKERAEAGVVVCSKYNKVDCKCGPCYRD